LEQLTVIEGLTAECGVSMTWQIQETVNDHTEMAEGWENGKIKGYNI